MRFLIHLHLALSHFNEIHVHKYASQKVILVTIVCIAI